MYLDRFDCKIIDLVKFFTLPIDLIQFFTLPMHFDHFDCPCVSIVLIVKFLTWSVFLHCYPCILIILNVKILTWSVFLHFSGHVRYSFLLLMWNYWPGRIFHTLISSNLNLHILTSLWCEKSDQVRFFTFLFRFDVKKSTWSDFLHIMCFECKNTDLVSFFTIIHMII